MPKDNLLSSACLELFEHIKKENVKDLIKHLMNNHRDILQSLSYMPTFRDIIIRFDQTQGYTANMEYFMEPDEELSRKPPRNARLMEHISVDPEEEEYWNTSDPEDEDDNGRTGEKTPVVNGLLTPTHQLVDYSSDEEGEEKPNAEQSLGAIDDQFGVSMDEPVVAPPERLSEKRRREEDEEEDLGKALANKRRNSTSSGSGANVGSPGLARRRKSITSSTGSGNGNGNAKKISISLSSAIKTNGDSSPTDNS